MGDSLLIVGVSARAAAWSARRAGFTPLAVDRFLDTDLRAVAHAVRARPYPAAIPEAARQLGAAPVMYTGALENHPTVLDQLAGERPLLGNPGQTVKRVRDPFRLASALRAIGLPMPDTRPSSEGLPRDGSWLVKRKRSSGGGHVRPWRGSLRDGHEDHYFQRRVDGITCGAVFLGAGGHAHLVGTSQQLVGCYWTGATAYRYAGSIGPLKLSSRVRQEWLRIGNQLASEFNLVGLFGVDAVLQGQRLWPLEVNPRYTASVEVLERAFELQAVRWHVQACRDQVLPTTDDETSNECRTVCGKAVLYARRTVRVGPAFAEMADHCTASSLWPTLADIPELGTEISGGSPVATVLAAGPDPRSVEVQLRKLCADVERTL
jgi:predicted ATP-grasp superfamily ATP-dependent carboligase